MDLGPLNKTTPEESGVVAIETKTNDFPLSAEVVYPRIYSEPALYLPLCILWCRPLVMAHLFDYSVYQQDQDDIHCC